MTDAVATSLAVRAIGWALIVINILQTTVETLLFYHPVVWWISRQIRVEREQCCDDAAVELCGDRVRYARALADLEELRSGRPAFALAATSGPLEARIRRLLRQSSANNDRSSPTWIVVGVLLTVLSIALMGEDVKSVSRAGSALLEQQLDQRLDEVLAELRQSALASAHGERTSNAAQAPDTTQTAPVGEGVIRGRIVDARSGRPLEQAAVAASQFGRGEKATTADADGRYEVRGLEPGEYRLFARAAGYVEGQYGQRHRAEAGASVEVRSGQVISGVDVHLQPASVVTGRIFNVSGEGLPGVEIQLIAERYRPGGPARVPVAWAQTGELGLFRISELPPGQYYVRAHVTQPIPSSGTDRTKVYAPTYFPQATKIEEAQPVLVSAGQEVFDIDLALLMVDTFDVAGSVVDPTGQPLDQKVVMFQRDGSAGFGQTVPVSSAGRFRISNLVPGDYVLKVLDSSERIRGMAVPGVRVTVDDHVSGVELAVPRGARVEGRLVPDGARPLPFDPGTIRLALELRPGDGGVFNSSLGTVVQPDGTFSIDSVVGPATLQVSELPAGWTVKAIRLEGSDITYQATDFGDGVRQQVEIVLTDQFPQVTHVIGRVTDRRGRVVSNYIVVVFPEDRDRWKPPSRFVQAVRSRPDGLYRIQALPPADYLAIAVELLPEFAWSDPRVLERLWPSATPFRLREGEQRTVQLRLSPTPDGLLAEH